MNFNFLGLYKYVLIDFGDNILKKVFFALGGAGNVYFQIVKAKSVSNEYVFCDFLINSSVRRLLNHTNHKNVYRTMFEVNKGGSYVLPLFLLDILLSRFFSVSLFTDFDTNFGRMKPFVFDLIYCGYYQNDVNVMGIVNGKEIIRSKSEHSGEVASDRDGELCIHIRGGDFKNSFENEQTSSLSISYYQSAIKNFRGVKKISVVTNDKELSLDIMNALGINSFELFMGSEVEDFWKIHTSKFVICSNSTFSMVAAMSNNNISQLVLPKMFESKFTGFEFVPFCVQFVE